MQVQNCRIEPVLPDSPYRLANAQNAVLVLLLSLGRAGHSAAISVLIDSLAAVRFPLLLPLWSPVVEVYAVSVAVAASAAISPSPVHL